ncbi:hypothetical protein PGQ11_004346 [Apiospora arundinis]|uniref:Uncharacterized protein n=1 Tax=Apiospora arundinis TaxID=335852 RepID=A0ABR2J8U4_9PEZI
MESQIPIRISAPLAARSSVSSRRALSTGYMQVPNSQSLTLANCYTLFPDHLPGPRPPPVVGSNRGFACCEKVYATLVTLSIGKRHSSRREQLRTVHDATRFDRPLCLYCIPPAPSWSTPRLPLGTHNQLHAAAILNIVSCRPLRARLDLLGLAGIVLHTTPDSETLDAAVVRLEFTVIV